MHAFEFILVKNLQPPKTSKQNDLDESKLLNVNIFFFCSKMKKEKGRK